MFASVYLKIFTSVPFHFKFVKITFGWLLFSTGSSLSKQVHQTPAGILTTAGGTASINCSHSIMNYERILWYRQTPRGGLQLLGSVAGTYAMPQAGPNVRMVGGAFKGQISTLTVNNVSSSAVYFCAAYHSGSHHS